jgi:hypothetical protein
MAYLQEAMSPHRAIPIAKLAKALKIHPETLKHEMKRHGVTWEFAALSDRDLDCLVKVYKSTKPDSGIRYLVGFLCYHGLRVQRKRVIHLVKQVDSVGRALRMRKIIKQRKYSVQRPNSLWHLDGYHKLIMWGINRASTVPEVLLSAVKEYNCPDRMRGDRGGENKATAVYMIMRKGPNRASFM